MLIAVKMRGSMQRVKGYMPSDLSTPARLLVLAGPIIASVMSRTVMGFIDFVMVSKLGTEAQAAIMPAGIVLWCVIAFGMGLAGAVNTYVAQAFGRQSPADCTAYTWQGLHLSVFLGIIFLPAWFIVPRMFAWIGHDAAVQEMETVYTQIGLLTIGPQTAAMVLSSFFNGIHRPGIGLVAAVLSNIFNAVVNYALIFGHFGFEPMGIAGAAWGTFAASMFQVVVLLGWMGWGTIVRTYPISATWQLDWARMKAIVRVGLPMGAQFCMDVVAFAVFTLFLIGWFGTVHLAAHGIALKVLEISFMPTIGLGTAVLSMVGKSIGERRPDLAHLNARWGAGIGVAYMGGMGAMFLVFPRPLAGLLTDDPAVLDAATMILRICAFYQVFDALGIVYNHALRGAGDTRWPAIAGMLLSTIIMLGGGWAAAVWMPQWKSAGPWAAATVYAAAYGLAMWLRFKRGAWEKIELLPENGNRNTEVATPG